MGKKLSLITIMILSAFIIVLVNKSDKTNNQNLDNNNQKTTENTDSSNENLEHLDDSIVDDNPLLNLTFESGVNINDIKLINNQYIALGEKDNVPYMQSFNYNDNSLVAQGSPYLFNRGVGTITDITLKSYYLTAAIENENSTYTQKFIESKKGFIPFYKEQIQYNYYKDSNIKPKYIVIHETANTGVGADADAHYRYWNRDPNASTSTHFVVDNTQIYQMLELNQAGWHVGDNHGHSDITNFNSIGIEVAVNVDGNFTVARQNAIDLTIKLMKELDLDMSSLKRHYDASGKYCPTNMLQTPELWNDFVEQVRVGLEN